MQRPKGAIDGGALKDAPINVVFTLFAFAASVLVYKEGDLAEAMVFGLGNALAASACIHAVMTSYRGRYLLEPLVLFVIPTYIFLGPGNWPPVSGMDMLGHGEGVIQYYPEMSFWAGIGLWSYVISYKAFRINYDPLVAACRYPTKFTLLFFLSVGSVLVYFGLNLYIPMGTHGFTGVGDQLEGMPNWIALTAPIVPSATIISAAFLWNRNWTGVQKMLLFAGIVANFVVLFSFVHRTPLILTIFAVALARMHWASVYGSSRRRITPFRVAGGTPAEGAVSSQERPAYSAITLRVPMILAASLCGCLLVYGLGAQIKAAYRAGIPADRAGLDHVSAIIRRGFDSESIEAEFMTDLVYRAAGLEWPAQIRGGQVEGHNLLWGYASVIGVANSLPRFVSEPLGLAAPRDSKVSTSVTVDEAYGLRNCDRPSSVLASGMADFGPLGVIFYFSLVGIFHARIVTRLFLNPYTVIAYLGTIPVLAEPRSIETTMIDYLKFLGFLALLTIPLVIWSTRNARKI